MPGAVTNVFVKPQRHTPRVALTFAVMMLGLLSPPRGERTAVINYPSGFASSGVRYGWRTLRNYPDTAIQLTVRAGGGQ